MDWRLRLPGGLYRRAAEKAGGDTQLAQRVRIFLERYTADQPQQAVAAAARAASLTPERRSEIARTAALARHRKAEE